MLPSLIQQCVCGNFTNFTETRKNGIELLRCKRCRVHHQVVRMTEDEYNNFYNTEYHSTHQTSIGCKPYDERYLHDLDVGKLRIKAYSLLGELRGKRVLDVGSGNGAFVDACRSEGIEAFGVDLGTLGNPKYTFTGQSLLDLKLSDMRHTYDIITMHDVFEHLVEPIKHLQRAYSFLKTNGYLIIDFPNYYVNAGKHHWRAIQHLWYFTLEELRDLVEVNHFTVDGTHIPIPSKVVLYCRKL